MSTANKKKSHSAGTVAKFKMLSVIVLDSAVYIHIYIYIRDIKFLYVILNGATSLRYFIMIFRVIYLPYLKHDNVFLQVRHIIVLWR